MSKQLANHTTQLAIVVFALLLLIPVSISLNSGVNGSLLKLNADLRSRITGTRILLESKDPYFYVWQKSDPKTRVDFTANPTQFVSRLTVPPSMLLFHIPLANLPYFNTMMVWMMLEWLAYLLLALVIIKTQKKLFTKLTTLVIFSLFSLSPAWIHHLHLGQLYIFYILFAYISALLFLNNKNKFTGSIIPGLLLGLLVATRPQYVLIFIPLLLKRFDKKLVFSSVISFFSIILLSVIIFSPSSWINYLKAMGVQSQITYVKDIIPANIASYYPDSAEGLRYVYRGNQGFWTHYESSVKGVFKNIFNINLDNKILLLVGITLILACTRTTLKEKVVLNNKDTLTTFAFLFVIIAEIFTPAPRYTYYDVILLPLLVYVIFSKLKSLHKLALVSLFAILQITGYFDTPVYFILLYLWLACIYLNLK